MPESTHRLSTVRRPATPLPGRPVKGSKTGRPIMAALDLLSRRWVLRIVWELRNGARGFREIQVLCDQMSPNTLSTRLSELKEAGLVAHDVNGDWRLTDLGRQLGPALKALNTWATTWERDLAADKPATPAAPAVPPRSER